MLNLLNKIVLLDTEFTLDVGSSSGFGFGIANIIFIIFGVIFGLVFIFTFINAIRAFIKSAKRNINTSTKDLKDIFTDINNKNLTLSKESKKDIVEETEKCDNCGANLTLTNGRGTCPYCGTKMYRKHGK